MRSVDLQLGLLHEPFCQVTDDWHSFWPCYIVVFPFDRSEHVIGLGDLLDLENTKIHERWGAEQASKWEGDSCAVS